MRTIAARLTLAALTVAAVGCDPSSQSPAESSQTDPATSAVQPAVAPPEVSPEQARHQEQQQRLSMRLTALDFFAERMWPGHDGEAGLNWLRTSAAGSGLELTRVMPEVVIERQGVAVRPAMMQAEGEWADVVGWLQAIEASPRRLILREVELHTLRNRVVAQLKVGILLDRPTGLTALAEMNVADLRNEELELAVSMIEAELRGKSQTLEQLGADASWSQPIAELTSLMPGSAKPVKLSIARTGNGERAQSFDGTFTLVVPDAGLVPDYIRTIQKHPGFADANLESLRNAGADWQRAAVTFTFTGQAEPTDTAALDVAAAAE
ncbi:hypothetical protein [Algisphaera agarilytica]|uniref:Lipoprotein n=1 Tax=Algisphaera agarilytica TaxID=1385975 RepID=A0A7X0HB87_9BACT|nr:hypothetical protein [Algisphaera agarilytica]MBB6431556.1 hypothetical protein [Algisphaera agarilytica]